MCCRRAAVGRTRRASYGPYKTLYNPHKHWLEKGVWQTVFEALAAAGGPPAEVLIDSTHVKAHRSAAGGKGGARPGDRHQPRRTQHQDPRHRRRPRQAARLPPDAGSGGGLSSGRSVAGQPAGPVHRPCGPRLWHQPHPRPHRAAGCRSQHPAQGQSTLKKLLQPQPLQGAQRRRAHVLPPQGLPAPRHAL